MMETGIEIRHLTKRFKTRLAIDDLSLEIQLGEIFGFVGPNGAGKTTTMRILCGLLKPDAGEIKINGLSALGKAPEINHLIGYMPDEFGVYPDLLTWEYLDFFAACYGMNTETRSLKIEALLDLVDLQHRKYDFVDQLSHGMKQRLSLARVLIHDPKFLILDEPAAGLDPRARIEIRELILELASMGKSIFFSSHILADVEEICDRVGIIEEGKLVSVGKLSDMHLQRLKFRKIHLIVLGTDPTWLGILEQINGVSNIQKVELKENTDGKTHVEFFYSRDDPGLSEVLSTLINQGIKVLNFYEETVSLEEIFMHATKGQVS